MKTYKRRIEHFAYYDFDGIIRHLEHMAYNGWALRRITPFFWEYEQIPARTYTYAWTFSAPEAAFMEVPTADCAWSGIDFENWKFVTQWHHIHIYCKEGKAERKPQEHLQRCLNMVQAHMRLNIVPFAVFMMIFSVISLFFAVRNMQQSPILFLTDHVCLMTALLWVVLLLYQVVRIVHCAFWLKRTRQLLQSEERDGVPSGGIGTELGKTERILGQIGYFGILIFFFCQTVLLFLRVFAGRSTSVSMVGIGSMILLLSLRRILRNRRKHAGITIHPKGASARLAVFLLIMVMAAMSTTLFGEKYDHFLYRSPLSIQRITLSTGMAYDFAIYQDALPLNMKDLAERTSPQTSQRYDVQSSVLGTYHRGMQSAPPNDNEVAGLYYTILESRFSKLLDFAQMQMEQATTTEEHTASLQEAKERKTQYQVITVAGMGNAADTIYQKFYQTEPCNEFILRKADRLVQISFSWQPSAEQLHIAAEKLLKPDRP